MKMIKIEALENGAHLNQTFHGVLPEGWALMTVEPTALENFPFGSFDVEDVDGVPYMKADSWVPGVMPEIEDVPKEEPEEPNTELTDAEMAEAIREGVNAI